MKLWICATPYDLINVEGQTQTDVTAEGKLTIIAKKRSCCTSLFSEIVRKQNGDWVYLTITSSPSIQQLKLKMYSTVFFLP